MEASLKRRRVISTTNLPRWRAIRGFLTTLVGGVDDLIGLASQALTVGTDFSVLLSPPV